MYTHRGGEESRPYLDMYTNKKRPLTRELISNKSMGQYPEKVSFIISQVEERPVPVALYPLYPVGHLL